MAPVDIPAHEWSSSPARKLRGWDGRLLPLSLSKLNLPMSFSYLFSHLRCLSYVIFVFHPNFIFVALMFQPDLSIFWQKARLTSLSGDWEAGLDPPPPRNLQSVPRTIDVNLFGLFNDSLQTSHQYRCRRHMHCEEVRWRRSNARFIFGET